MQTSAGNSAGFFMAVSQLVIYFSDTFIFNSRIN